MLRRIFEELKKPQEIKLRRHMKAKKNGSAM
jgi:hypothetical protein